MNAVVSVRGLLLAVLSLVALACAGCARPLTGIVVELTPAPTLVQGAAGELLRVEVRSQVNGAENPLGPQVLSFAGPNPLLLPGSLWVYPVLEGSAQDVDLTVRAFFVTGERETTLRVTLPRGVLRRVSIVVAPPEPTRVADPSVALSFARDARATLPWSATASSFECAGDFHVCGEQCVSTRSPTYCGRSCTPCPGAADGVATCSASGVCGIVCDPGFELAPNGTCVASATSVRALEPLSGWVLSNPLVLAWSAPPSGLHAQLLLCTSRACAGDRQLVSLPERASRLPVDTTALAAGRLSALLFWRVRLVDASERPVTAWSVPWSAHVEPSPDSDPSANAAVGPFRSVFNEDSEELFVVGQRRDGRGELLGVGPQFRLDALSATSTLSVSFARFVGDVDRDGWGDLAVVTNGGRALWLVHGSADGLAPPRLVALPWDPTNGTITEVHAFAATEFGGGPRVLVLGSRAQLALCGELPSPSCSPFAPLFQPAPGSPSVFLLCPQAGRRSPFLAVAALGQTLQSFALSQAAEGDLTPQTENYPLATSSLPSLRVASDAAPFPWLCSGVNQESRIALEVLDPAAPGRALRLLLAAPGFSRLRQESHAPGGMVMVMESTSMFSSMSAGISIPVRVRGPGRGWRLYRVNEDRVVPLMETTSQVQGGSSTQLLVGSTLSGVLGVLEEPSHTLERLYLQGTDGSVYYWDQHDYAHPAFTLDPATYQGTPSFVSR